MSIIYTLIAKSSDKVLCEFTDYHGNFEQVSRSLLKKVQGDHKATFSYDDAENNLTLMCMCEIKYPSKSAFVFLNDLRKVFLETYTQSEIDNSISYSLNDKFQDKIKYKIEFYNKNNETGFTELDCVSSNNLKLNTSSETSISTEQQEEKINLVVKRHVNLKASSFLYPEKSKGLRTQIRIKRLKIIFFLISALILLAYFISIISCGGFDYPNCRSE